MSEKRTVQFRKETESDSELQKVVNHINDCWPESYKNVDSSVKTYKVKNDLHVNDGLLFIKEKLVAL